MMRWFHKTKSLELILMTEPNSKVYLVPEGCDEKEEEKGPDLP